MTAASDFAATPPFATRCAAEQRVPFVFNSPHSGRFYPERFLAMTRLDANGIRRSEDCYVDELFAGAVALGAPMLAANFPRAYLDVNREPWELDPRMFAEPVPPYANTRSARVAGGLGTVPRLVGEGQEIYSGKLSLSEAMCRVEVVYKPYHECLKHLLAETHAAFGYAVLIDCHSMPASVRLGDSGIRPDFIIGDRFGVACSSALSDAAIGLLTAMGYTVAHNKPYAGGFITEHYGRPAKGLHALQIEVNRGLYMNEKTFEKTSGFGALATDLARFTADIMALPDYSFHGMPLAAE
ncbi:N-formylglutamate amidohydrolase [Aquamicrobium sp. LC103]|uniref:N-formylglutamate amidohydrolase n=1 Tax=Aquamicrobium sp. LC103 TaxID=1120658 RepID=UPI00063EB609|nr:N-formylglutamate amidohydrolase [Aquamicrobium sp. LC103]TKT77551.1 N-formylglutamate amidohydrolase [Aquamicrobium sp. LC103]